MAPAGGGGAELQEAMARRVGALNQQGVGAAGGGSPLPSLAPSQAPQMVPGASSGATGASSERVDDAHIILKAMSQRLKSQEKIAEAQSIPPKMPLGLGM